MHLDGARIWQCRGYYGKSFAEIGEVFDSVYVSFYKELGAMGGAMLLGPEDIIAVRASACTSSGWAYSRSIWSRARRNRIRSAVSMAPA